MADHLKLVNLFIFLLLASIGHAKSNIPSDTHSSPFEFIRKLEGVRKGDTAKGINELKTYLKRFGYLEHLSEPEANTDTFDDILESAIKTYQKNFKIKPTGVIDADTISKMTTGRCGVPDIIKGTNYMQPRKTSHNSSNIHTVSHYNFIPGTTWQPVNRHLTYKLLNEFPQVAKLPVERAFERWASVTQLTFSEGQGGEMTDLTLGFYSGEHGDASPFDGRGGVIAHATFPPDGKLHFDIDELWFYILKTSDSFDILTVALHEIGHLLGLQHSSDQSAVMYPTIGHAEIKDLGEDDIQGIRALYNL